MVNNGYLYNPKHICTAVSEGCKNCKSVTDYDRETVKDVNTFGLYMENIDEDYRLIYTTSGIINDNCMYDFFHEGLDIWRIRAWQIMKERKDLEFTIFTKRIDRIHLSLPDDWKKCYDNVTVACLCENQKNVDERLNRLINLPIKKKKILLYPLLESVYIASYLKKSKFLGVMVGGEYCENPRKLDYEWVLDVRKQCMSHNVSFLFYQTGSLFVKDSRKYAIKNINTQFEQANKARLNINCSLQNN